MKLAELRCVRWQLEGQSDSSEEVVPEADVDLLCAALLELHLERGVNPHSGRPVAKLTRLMVGSPLLREGYWWTGPTLEDDGPRARVLRWDWEARWLSPEESDPPDPVEGQIEGDEP